MRKTEFPTKGYNCTVIEMTKGVLVPYKKHHQEVLGEPNWNQQGFFGTPQKSPTVFWEPYLNHQGFFGQLSLFGPRVFCGRLIRLCKTGLTYTARPQFNQQFLRIFLDLQTQERILKICFISDLLCANESSFSRVRHFYKRNIRDQKWTFKYKIMNISRIVCYAARSPTF